LKPHLVNSFTHAAFSPDPDLAVAALMIARVEYPKLEAGPYLDQLDALGHEARRRVASAAASPGQVPPQVDPDRYARVMALNDYLFGELRFVGNEVHYEDPRNSFLNEVLDRRTGIPITLALLYMEVARRADLPVEGINFPGRFLLRCPARRGLPYSEDLIIDAFRGGALLTRDACRDLLRPEGADEGLLSDDDGLFESRLFVHATKLQILARMLGNLKRVYVRMHSFPQARDVTELMLAVDPSATNELRDRGLLAYHMEDFAAALKDLEAYLRLMPRGEAGDPGHDHDPDVSAHGEDGDDPQESESAQIWEHVKTLRRRVAGFN